MRILQGRSTQFRTRLAGYWDDLYRVAYSWCHDPQLASDLAQETSLKAMRNAHSLKQDGAMKSWLFSIMHNCWCDMCRRRREFSELQEHHLVYEEDGEDDVYRRQITQKVHAAIEKLKPEQREIVSLVDLAAFSYQEVANILDIPLGTVMSRLSRARTQLREHLQEFQQSKTTRCNYVRRVK
ncbi:RNA polymerase sigma factor [Sulfuriflexus mobilis]|uniref:RNA polymerase sigma factor n=1 Tax=Sulfuriflexus mobilis TaxID=1811807 RepID=UPI000F83CD14|nr:sigma-70 family RNA polymerase sigma factor [Sulfuriflexus mobilis]